MDHDWYVRNSLRDSFVNNIIGYRNNFKLVLSIRGSESLKF